MCSSNKIKLKKPIKSFKDKRINLLEKKLIKIFKFLSEQIVRDGEGATKLINIIVNGFYVMNYLSYYSLRLGGFLAWNGHRKRNAKIKGVK